MVNFSSSYIKSFSDLVQKNVTNMVINTEQSASQFCDANAEIKIVAGGDITIDGNVTATAKGFCHLETMFSSDSKLDFSVQMSSVIDKTIAQDTTQESSLVSFLQLNIGMSRQDIESRIKNIIERNITQETIQKALQSASVNAKNELIATGNIIVRGNIGSHVQADIVGKFISDSVTSILTQDSMIQKVEETLEQKNKQKEEGLTGVIFYIVMAILAVIFLLFLLPTLLGGGGGNANQKIEIYADSPQQ